MISDKERDRRINENNGFIREKVNVVAVEALWTLITSEEEVDPARLCAHVRHLARTWIDRDDDFYHRYSRYRYERLHGVSDSRVQAAERIRERHILNLGLDKNEDI